MFQTMAQGASLYILHKNEPKVDVGRVISVNTHLPQYNPTQPQAMFNGMVTDLTVSVGSDTVPFLALPASASVANFADKGLFISEDQGLVINEITTLRDNSKRIIDSYESNKDLFEKYEELLLSMNPDKQREVRSAKELAELKDELSDMKRMLSAILGTKTKEE
jgi:hypothetical protein